MSISAESEKSMERLRELVKPTSYDNGKIYLYKKAIELGVPIRYVLIQPSDDSDPTFLESFDLEKEQNDMYETIFNFIRQLVAQDLNVTLDQIWDIINNFNGDPFNRTEIIWIWLYALPEFQIDNELVLQQIHTHLKNTKEPIDDPFNDMTQVLNYFVNNWYLKFQEEYTHDLAFLERAVRIQEEINSFEPVRHSDITISSITVVYDYSYEAGINPLVDIFDSAINSYKVPFIQYNIRPLKGEEKSTKRYFKIYKGKSLETQPNYNNIILTPESKKGQIIYLNVWTGENVGDEEFEQEEARMDKKDMFTVVMISYNEKTSTIRITLKAELFENIDEMTIINRIHKHLPGLPPTPSKTQLSRIQSTGYFYIYNTGFGQELFSYLVMNDPLFNNYLYLEERTAVFPTKTNFIVHYRGASSETIDFVGKNSTARVRSPLSSTLIVQRFSAGQQVLFRGESKPVPLAKDTGVVLVRIDQARSGKIIEQFLNVLTRLFQKFMMEGKSILKMFDEFVPENKLLQNYQEERQKIEFDQMIGTQVPYSTKEGRVNLNYLANLNLNKELRKYAPDVFVAGYARNCQGGQPKLIRPEEIDIWENHRDGQGEKRQILAFPPNKPKYYLVCPTDRFPYPTLRENTLPNKNVYSDVPCCFAAKELANKRLIQYGQGKKVRAKTTKSSYIIRSGKHLEPGGKGSFSPVIQAFLKKSDEEYTGEFYRRGVPRDTNSFIHCVLTGLEQPDYMISPDKEGFVINFRNQIFGPKGTLTRIFKSGINPGPHKQYISEDLVIRPELLRQELYDMSDEEIRKIATDNDKFFDPLLFYRLLEVIFDSNIYVFALTDIDRETNRKTSILKLPRHKYFHSHPPNPYKPVLLIIRHWGSKTKYLDYPQCEIIFNEQSVNEVIYQFGDSVNERIYPALMFVGRTLTWQISEISKPENPSEKIPQLTARKDIYSTINYSIIFGDIPIIAQVIDSAGKARMFALAPEINDQGTEYTGLRVFVNVPPTAPLNVPEFKPEDIVKELSPYQKLIEMFGEPVSATVSANSEYLTGLWFPISDIQFGFYGPCKNSPWSEFLQKYPNINTNSELAALTINIPRESLTRSGKLSPIQRIRYLNRASKFIDQIIKYLYLVAQKPKDIDEFLFNILAFLDQSVLPDSLDIYDIRAIARILPSSKGPNSMENVQSILRILSSQAPTIFVPLETGVRILIYNQKMLDGIRYQLKRFAKTMEGLNIETSQLRELQNFYDSINDFNFDPQAQFILSSTKEFNDWKSKYVYSYDPDQQLIQSLNNNIQTTLSPVTFRVHEPYIYQQSKYNIIKTNYYPERDEFYLIQNVSGNEFLRAIQVAYTWYMEKRNTGFGTRPYQIEEEMIPAHVIYSISPSGGTIISQNNRNGNEWYLEILKYDERSYAAMLPIF